MQWKRFIESLMKKIIINLVSIRSSLILESLQIFKAGITFPRSVALICLALESLISVAHLAFFLWRTHSIHLSGAHLLRPTSIGISPSASISQSTGQRTFEEYQHLLENEGGAPNDFTVHDIDETYSEEDNHYNHDYGDDDDSDVVFDLDPSLIPLPEGFNDDEEVLTIDAQGNVSKLRGRITVNVVIGLDAGTRILVPMNKLLQPVKKAGGLFNRFLANIAKRPRFCSINYSDWRVVPTLYKNRILDYIKVSQFFFVSLRSPLFLYKSLYIF
ncbi:hypothetical protein DM860_011205 [Cuscuta australis]|uniref:Uncharacterized protein n=1 Tax=Cuscuta australis TaxID=267555 RepID=A0A328DP64_9ASTE|nr:hypothetical protein DM860_011205 [Cuscuta australis]